MYRRLYLWLDARCTKACHDVACALPLHTVSQLEHELAKAQQSVAALKRRKTELGAAIDKEKAGKEHEAVGVSVD